MIYTNYWGLGFHPFGNDNQPETFVPTRTAALVITKLRYALGIGMGTSALFGEAGVGKTRVARILQAEFTAARWRTAYLPNTLGGARDILAALDPEAAALAPSGTSGLGELERYLADRARENQPVLIIVDDVQASRGVEFLETLRTLQNIDHDGVKALSILLLGQAAMDRRLEQASHFNSQLLVRAVLDPMTDEESRLYILARLKAAGSRQGIFTKQAADRVVKFSKGIPRQVNRLCELSLVIAYGLEEGRVSPEIVEMAAADLDLLPPGEASFFRWPHPAPAVPDEPAESADSDADGEDILATLAAEPAG